MVLGSVGWKYEGISFFLSNVVLKEMWSLAHLHGNMESSGRAPELWSKGCRFESRQERQENFLLWNQLSVPTLVSVSVPPHVTTEACKRSQSFCQKGAGGRLWLNTHAPYVFGFKWSDTVNWCMVVWHTQNVPRDSSNFIWHQPGNN